jgi:hypothetical protein
MCNTFISFFMHKGMLAAWLLLFSLAAQAQFTLSGAVTEAGTDQPLPGATVSPGGNGPATATGEGGRYQLTICRPAATR